MVGGRCRNRSLTPGYGHRVQRVIPDPGFAGDDGSPDAALEEALAAHAAGTADRAAVLAALAKARLLVAVVANPVDPGRGESGGVEMALVMLDGRDGRRALPAFTSLDAMRRWNPHARPVPSESRQVCSAAISEGADLVAVDPAGPVTYLVEGAALRSLAAGREPVPALHDPDVIAAVRAAVAGEPRLAAAYLLPAETADFVVGVVLQPGAGVVEAVEAAEAAETAGRLARRLAEEPTLRERLDRGLDLAVLPAGTAPEGGLLLLAR